MASTGTMRAAQFEPGSPDFLQIATDVPRPQLREGEVLVQVHMTAINRADTLQRQGKYPPPPGESPILGLEAAGVVAELGPNATKLKVGDRVMALLPGGGNAEYVCVQECHTMKIPAEMSWREAAAIPEVWLTAYQLLHFVGQVKKGDYVLIHAGASGVGTSAIQLTLLAGAIPIVTAGSPAKIDLAKKLGAVDGFNYKEGNFDKKVMEATKGHGADLILDCVGGSFWEQNVASAARGATWVLYGTMGGGEVNGPILRALMGKLLTIKPSTLRTRPKEYKAELIQAFAQNALPHFASGKLKPMIDTVMPLEQLADAHRMMESNKNAGKILIQVVKGENHEEL